MDKLEELKQEFNDLKNSDPDFDYETFNEWVEDQTDYTFCDKCKMLEEKGDLIWLTTEDFKYKGKEKLPPVASLEEAINKYDGLCKPCYEDELIIDADGNEMANGRRIKDYNLSEIQKEYLKKACPNCKTGKLYPVEGNNEEMVEDYLWCDNCLMSMDNSGGYTK